jgi:hypothetical protein
VAFLFRVERAAFGDCVPLLEAAAAACGCGVLCDEGGMVSHGRLLAVVGGLGGREAFVYEVGRVFEYDRQALRAKVGQLLPAQFKSASELRRAERREEFFDVAHTFTEAFACTSRRKLTTLWRSVSTDRRVNESRRRDEAAAANFLTARRVC